MNSVTLSQIGRIVTGKTPKTSREDFFGGDIPFITPSDMDTRRVISETARTLSEDGVASVKNCVVPAGSVMVSCIGSDMGKTYLLGKRSVTNQQINTLIVDELNFSPLYIYYNLFGRRAELREKAAGAAQPILNKTEFGKILVDVPPLAEQREIASILGALDDKIELNRRMAATLEEMARALYRSWFVDFDPVKAKAEGLAPAFMDEATAALFPDRFGDDGLPEGWLVSEIGKELDILDSKRIPLSKGQRNKRNGNIPYYGATSVMDFVDEALFDEVLLLVGEDGSVVRSNGKPFTQYIWGKAWVNNHAHVIKGHRFSVEQLKCIFDEIDIAPFVTGAVQAKLSQGNMKKIPFIEAAPEIHKAYDDQVSRFFEQIRLLSDESETLAELRDSLLPKLMSGELRVGEARDQIEEVA